MPWDVRPRRREAAAAVDDGVGGGVAPLRRGPFEERRPEVIPRKRYITLTEIERHRGHRSVHGLCEDGVGRKGHRTNSEANGPSLMYADDASSTGRARHEADASRRDRSEDKVHKTARDGDTNRRGCDAPADGEVGDEIISLG